MYKEYSAPPAFSSNEMIGTKQSIIDQGRRAHDRGTWMIVGLRPPHQRTGAGIERINIRQSVGKNSIGRLSAFAE